MDIESDANFMDSSPMGPEELGIADPSAETQNTEAAEDTQSETETVVEGEPEVKEEPKVEDRFDQHPRFKELIEAKNSLKGENDTLKKQLQDLAARVDGITAPKGRDFEKDLSALEEKLEAGDLDLAAFAKEQRKILAEQGETDRQRLLAEINQQGQLQKSQEQFLTDHPYINDVLQTKYDDVQRLRQANPLHDDVSAAMAVKIRDLETAAQDFETAKEAAIKEAVEKAKKETEETVIKNFKAKQQARSLGSGSRPAPDDDSLKDTSQQGGVRNVLAASLRRMRAQ